MAHFPIIEEADARDPQVIAIYAEIRQELGFGIVPNIFKSMAIRPTLLRAHWDKFRATILHGHLPRTLKEMIGILISQANQSEYAMRVHLHGLSAMGMSEEVLQTLVRDFANCPLPEREKRMLQFGLRAATDPLSITSGDYDALRTVDLSDEEIFEIVATADLFASINAYTDSAGIELDKLG
ncbi:MAG: carboxymuconolactone decarboxylase family protein [Roseiflexaceae bacterium]|nr:carboxymuconolactone decarboxylase family protein [Roseiflexaceae bacterium]